MKRKLWSTIPQESEHMTLEI